MTHIPSLFSPNTKISRSYNIAAEVLDFSKTKSGTHKYIKAEYVFTNFKINKYPIFCAISSGNYAYSLKLLAEKYKRQYLYLCMSNTDARELSHLDSNYSEVLPLDQLANTFAKDGSVALRYGLENDQRGFPILLNNKLVEAIKTFVVDRLGVCILAGVNIKNVTNISDIILSKEGGDFELKFSSSIKTKFKKNLIYDFGNFLKNYDYILCPLGSGELAYQIALQTKAKVLSFIPEGHPLNTGKVIDLSFNTTYADKLDTPVLPLRNYILNQKNIEIISVSNDEVLRAQQSAKDFGLKAEPSASIVFAALNEERLSKYRKEFQGSRVLIVNTGLGK